MLLRPRPRGPEGLLGSMPASQRKDRPFQKTLGLRQAGSSQALGPCCALRTSELNCSENSLLGLREGPQEVTVPLPCLQKVCRTLTARDSLCPHWVSGQGIRLHSSLPPCPALCHPLWRVQIALSAPSGACPHHPATTTLLAGGSAPGPEEPGCSQAKVAGTERGVWVTVLGLGRQPFRGEGNPLFAAPCQSLPSSAGKQACPTLPASWGSQATPQNTHQCWRGRCHWLFSPSGWGVAGEKYRSSHSDQKSHCCACPGARAVASSARPCLSADCSASALEHPV